MWNILMSSWTKSSQCIIDDAKEMWFEIEIVDVDKNYFIITKDWKSIDFKNIDCWLNSSLALKIADDKILTYKLLEKYNLPCPKSKYLKLWDEVSIDKLNLKLPIIVKPSDSWHWNWVTTNIN